MRRPLRKYQKDMLRYCLRVQHPALFVQMRLGKTIVTIRSLKIRQTSKNLIVAPYSALYGWGLELFEEDQEASGIVELFGSRQERLNLLEQNYSSCKWFLLNREGHLVIPEIADFHFDSVVLDESTFIKSPYSKKTGCQASRFFCENFRDTEYRYILTGTPSPEGELDYFCQIRFLHHRYWKEQNYYEFRAKNFGILYYTPYISPDGSRYLTKTLANRCYFLTRSDVKLGGEKIYEKRKIQLTNKVRKIYERVEKEFVLAYMDKEQDTIFATTKYIWLRRLCGGFADLEFISYSKLKELKYILYTELKGEQVLIIAKYVREIKKIAKFLSKENSTELIYGGVNKKRRTELYRDFQKGLIQYLVAQPQTIRHGVNLSASDTVIFYSSPDSGETRSQVEDRIIDTSKNDSSLIIDLFCENTVEEDVIRNLNTKKNNQEIMKEMVQRLQRKYNLCNI